MLGQNIDKYAPIYLKNGQVDVVKRAKWELINAKTVYKYKRMWWRGSRSYETLAGLVYKLEHKKILYDLIGVNPLDKKERAAAVKKIIEDIIEIGIILHSDFQDDFNFNEIVDEASKRNFRYRVYLDGIYASLIENISKSTQLSPKMTKDLETWTIQFVVQNISSFIIKSSIEHYKNRRCGLKLYNPSERFFP